MKYQCINGWTKEKMIAHIKAEFRGKAAQGLTCKYRALNGAKCVVGMFLPDDKYIPEMEGQSALGLLKNHPSVVPYMPLEKTSLDELQMCHDDSEPESTLQDLLNWVESNVQ
jgi:hypothetical protein